MIVWCDCYDCMFNREGQCGSEVLYLDEDHDCRDYESYRENEKWQTPYWKRLLDKNNNRVCRVKYYGNEFEVKGRKFYVDYKGEYASVTDGETGMHCGVRCELEKRIDRIIELAPTIEPRLEDLPIATYDSNTRTFTYESEVEGE